MRQELHDKLRYAQELLSHQVVPGDVAEVIERALDALIPKLEKQKFAATVKPRRSGDVRPSVTTARYVPAHVRQAVWKRDGGRCTFVSETGQRCSARTLLEFDHVEPVARGGQATVEGVRLLCRAHNQYGAERAFGPEFMKQKREARRAQRQARAATPMVKAREQARPVGPAPKTDSEVIECLRALRFRADESHKAAELCAARPHAPIEERVRLALTYFGRGRSPVGRIC